MDDLKSPEGYKRLSKLTLLSSKFRVNMNSKILAVVLVTVTALVTAGIVAGIMYVTLGPNKHDDSSDGKLIMMIAKAGKLGLLWLVITIHIWLQCH